MRYHGLELLRRREQDPDEEDPDRTQRHTFELDFTEQESEADDERQHHHGMAGPGREEQIVHLIQKFTQK